MVKYKEAFKRPFTDVIKLLIGILLNIIPIVNFLAQGYHLECARTSNKKKYKLPKWKNWGNLFVRGLLSTIIGIIYLLPTLIILFIGVGTAFLTTITTQEILPILATGGPLIIIGLILGIVTAYIAPMAIINYAMNYKFLTGFEFGKIFKKAFTGTYFVAWLLVGIYGVVLSLIFNFIPVVGSGISSFIAGITMFTVLGEIYSKV